MVAEFNIKTARYITGYVAKKMTRRDDPRLNGMEPEFARMSLNPGIGADAIPDVASVMMQYKLEGKLADVPTALRHGGSELPLGRYLRKLLRVQVGLDEKAPPNVLEALRTGLLPVFEAVDCLLPRAPGEVKKAVASDLIRQVNEQYARNAVAKLKQRRPL